MAAKRKVAAAVSEDAPREEKKSRTATGSNDSTDASDGEAGPISDASADRKIQFITDAGTKRADSEAKRSWNYVCEYEGCGQRFNRPCRLESHMRTHTKERPFFCTHEGCDRTFPRKDHLQRHLTHFHATADRLHACDWEGCGKTFASNGRLQRHKEVHESKFYCTEFPPCKEVFRKQKTLDAHISTVHMSTKPYPCTFVDQDGTKCTHGYQTEMSLRRHTERIHGTKQEPQSFCMLCPTPGTECEMVQNDNGETVPVPKEPLGFVTAAELKVHEKDFHPPTCPACGQVFTTLFNFTVHYKATHESPGGQELFQCPYEYCGKTFNRRSNRDTHVHAVHENQKRFSCTAEAMNQSKHPDLNGWDGENACGKLMKTKAALEQHIRTHHLGLPNRKATRKLAKAQKPSRKRLIPDPSPLSLLTGVGYEQGRPIACFVPDCPNRFSRDRDLKRHMIAEHDYTDADVEASILERDAANGGQFWIGGLDDFDPMSMSGSVDPSVPQTPTPYFGEQTMDLGGGFGQPGKPPIDPALLDTNMFDAGDMDVDMDGAQEAVQLGFLDPVLRYNDQMMQG